MSWEQLPQTKPQSILVSCPSMGFRHCVPWRRSWNSRIYGVWHKMSLTRRRSPTYLDSIQHHRFLAQLNVIICHHMSSSYSFKSYSGDGIYKLFSNWWLSPAGPSRTSGSFDGRCPPQLSPRCLLFHRSRFAKTPLLSMASLGLNWCRETTGIKS